MKNTRNILILGASYGSLLAAKLLLAGHRATLVCLPDEARLINAEGIRVRTPVKGKAGLVEIDSRKLPGRLDAAGPEAVTPAQYDLVVLAMQEPQYRAGAVRDLLNRIALARVPSLSIMNMPPLPYLKRLPGVDADALRSCYADPTVWDAFEPGLLSLCSPDPQAFRPPEEPANVLQVRLPTNFKAAPFADPVHTALLRELEADIDAVRFDAGDGVPTELPVKLRVYDSLFVPLAKWSMLVAGNYRCIQDGPIRPTREAVHADLNETRRIYESVGKLCQALGARESDLVPFDKYAAAALSLETPSSVARALYAGAPFVERIDRLVQLLARQQGILVPELDRIVRRVDQRLEENRKAKAAA